MSFDAAGAAETVDVLGAAAPADVRDPVPSAAPLAAFALEPCGLLEGAVPALAPAELLLFSLPVDLSAAFFERGEALLRGELPLLGDDFLDGGWLVGILDGLKILSIVRLEADRERANRSSFGRSTRASAPRAREYKSNTHRCAQLLAVPFLPPAAASALGVPRGAPVSGHHRAVRPAGAKSRVEQGQWP